MAIVLCNLWNMEERKIPANGYRKGINFFVDVYLKH